jgi:hypothetical protein
LSAIETSADVSITVTADDQASLEIDQATKRINKSFSDMRVQQRQATREFEVNNRVLLQGSRVMSSLGRVVSRTIAIYNTFQLHQLRLGQATDRVTASTRDLNEAFLEFGEGKETGAIRERMQKEMEDLKRIQDESALIIGLTALQAVSAIGSVLSRTLPQLIKFKATVQSIGVGGALAGGSVASKSPVGGLIGGGGGSSKLSKVAKGGGAILGVGLFIGGVASSQLANPDRELTTEEKLISLAEQTAGGALTGAVAGSVVPVIGTAIGAGIGAGVGLTTGVITNFGGDIVDAFTSDEEKEKAQRTRASNFGAGATGTPFEEPKGAITIINNVFSPSSQETVDEIADNTVRSLPFGNNNN